MGILGDVNVACALPSLARSRTAVGPPSARAEAADRDRQCREAVAERFLRASNSQEGRELKRRALAEILLSRPDLSASALECMVATVDKSTGLEGRRAKLEGLTRLYQSHPCLSDEMLDEVCKFVNGSNSVEGYRAKLDNARALLDLQPGMSPRFMAQFRVFVDESQTLANRQMKMDQVRAMLEKQPAMTPEMLREVREFVNDSLSLRERAQKLRGLNGILQRLPGLDEARVQGLAAGVNSGTDPEDRCLVMGGLEEAFRYQPSLPPASMKEMADFAYGGGSRNGIRERLDTALDMLRLNPQASSEDLRRVGQAAGSAVSPADGALRARVAAHDVVIAGKLGMAVEDMFRLAPVAACTGPVVAAAVLQEDSPLALAQDSLLVCRDQARDFADACALPREALLRRYPKRELELRGKRVGRTGLKFLAVGLGAGLGAAALGQLGLVTALSVPACCGIGFGAAVASLPLLKRQLDRASEGMLRDELAQQRDYWLDELERHLDIEPALESHLAVGTPAHAAVDEREEIVLVGSVRVRRRGEEEEE